MNRSPHAHAIAPTPTEVACLLDCRCIAGESPIWSAREACLYFVDHQGRKIHRFAPDGGAHAVWTLPDVVTSIAPRAAGGLVITLSRSFALFDPATGRIGILAEPEPDRPGNRFNDGKCDRRGRFWAGTMGAQAWNAPVGRLYRLDPGADPVAMIDGVRCSNGLGWSPDDRTFYFAESFAHVIHAYDFDAESGALGARRAFARIDPGSGAFPDGLAVDAEGFVWNAQPVFGRIVRYAPDGSIDRIVETPVSRPTSCAFGGGDMGTLFITSATETLTAGEIADEPLAGGLFACRPGVRGLHPTPFAG